MSEQTIAALTAGCAVLAEKVGESVPAEFNIHDSMIVTLTEFGAEIWNARYADLSLFADGIPAPVEAGYILKEQMWGLMETFGPHISLSGKMPFLGASMAHASAVTKTVAAPASAPAVEPRSIERMMRKPVTLEDFGGNKANFDAWVASCVPAVDRNAYDPRDDLIARLRKQVDDLHGRVFDFESRNGPSATPIQQPSAQTTVPIGYVNLETGDFAFGFYQNKIPPNYFAVILAATSQEPSAQVQSKGGV